MPSALAQRCWASSQPRLREPTLLLPPPPPLPPRPRPRPRPIAAPNRLSLPTPVSWSLRCVYLLDDGSLKLATSGQMKRSCELGRRERKVFLPRAWQKRTNTHASNTHTRERQRDALGTAAQAELLHLQHLWQCRKIELIFAHRAHRRVPQPNIDFAHGGRAARSHGCCCSSLLGDTRFGAFLAKDRLTRERERTEE